MHDCRSEHTAALPSTIPSMAWRQNAVPEPTGRPSCPSALQGRSAHRRSRTPSARLEAYPSLPPILGAARQYPPVAPALHHSRRQTREPRSQSHLPYISQKPVMAHAMNTDSSLSRHAAKRASEGNTEARHVRQKQCWLKLMFRGCTALFVPPYPTSSTVLRWCTCSFVFS